MLAFYDSEYSLFNGEPLRSVHNGKAGGAWDTLIFLRNDDSANYYTNIILSYENSNYNDYGVRGDTGWGVKFLYGARQPTEAEWDSVSSGESLVIPDIGSTIAADTYTYHPIWVRVYCPGNTNAQIREGQLLKVSFSDFKVGD